MIFFKIGIYRKDTNLINKFRYIANREILIIDKLSYIEHTVGMKNEGFSNGNVNEEITALLEMGVSPDWKREGVGNDELFIYLVKNARRMIYG